MVLLEPIYSNFDDILQLVRHNSTVGYINVSKMYVKIEMTIGIKNNTKLKTCEVKIQQQYEWSVVKLQYLFLMWSVSHTILLIQGHIQCK